MLQKLLVWWHFMLCLSYLLIWTVLDLLPAGQDPTGVTRKERLLEIFGHW